MRVLGSGHVLGGTGPPQDLIVSPKGRGPAPCCLCSQPRTRAKAAVVCGKTDSSPLPPPITGQWSQGTHPAFLPLLELRAPLSEPLQSCVCGVGVGGFPAIHKLGLSSPLQRTLSRAPHRQGCRGDGGLAWVDGLVAQGSSGEGSGLSGRRV